MTWYNVSSTEATQTAMLGWLDTKFLSYPIMLFKKKLFLSHSAMFSEKKKLHKDPMYTRKDWHGWLDTNHTLRRKKIVW